MSNQETQAMPSGRPARTIRLKVAAWAVLALIVALAVVWFGKSMICGAALRDQAEDSAKSIASAIAAFGNQDIVSRNYRDLQTYGDDLVRQKPVAFVAIVDSRERVVVHTNREFLGRRADALTMASGVVEGKAQVMDVTRQAGTVLVGIRVR